ncbi:hypothetical protein MBLNU459_g2323t1 [Dothideomycetes sp. NU459]
MSGPEATWESICQRKRAQQISAIPKEWLLRSKPDPSRRNLLSIPRECGILTAKELEITEKNDATSLLQLLAAGKLSSYDVTLAFCKRAAIAQQLTNCLTEIFFSQALTRAKALDAAFARAGNRPTGLLHGLPVSLKDMFRVRGLDASIGIAALCFKPAARDSTLVDVLLRAGAVLYVKTNVPQTLMALDSHNNVFGRTLNPRDTALSAGGSSGGEGVLVAMRGSPLGVGTDVGGSIRIPAMCNGLVGIKPSHGRVTYAGLESGSKEGADAIAIRASAGPIATSVRDCEMFMRVLADLEAWKLDPEVLPQTWDMQIALQRGRPLKVGIVRTDGVATPLPPIARLMDEVAATLDKSSGVEVVDLDISPLLSKCQSLANAFFSIDGANTMFDLLEETSEPLSPWLQTRLRRKKRTDVAKVIELQARRTDIQTQFLKIWEGRSEYQCNGKIDGDIDVLLCPVAPHPTPLIDAWNTVSFTSSFVLLDYPAATLPVREFGPQDLDGELEGKGLGSWDQANRKLWTDVDRKAYLGSELCVQVVGRRRQERVVIEAMARLESALSGLRQEGSKARL